jgi:hypothetical protein
MDNYFSALTTNKQELGVLLQSCYINNVLQEDMVTIILNSVRGLLPKLTFRLNLEENSQLETLVLAARNKIPYLERYFFRPERARLAQAGNLECKLETYIMRRKSEWNYHFFPIKLNCNYSKETKLNAAIYALMVLKKACKPGAILTTIGENETINLMVLNQYIVTVQHDGAITNLAYVDIQGKQHALAILDAKDFKTTWDDLCCLKNNHQTVSYCAIEALQKHFKEILPTTVQLMALQQGLLGSILQEDARLYSMLHNGESRLPGGSLLNPPLQQGL